MRLLYVWLACALSFASNAQELFPLNLPASTIPKGALGVRASDENYKEETVYRNIVSVKAMYGVLSNLTVTGTATVSDYHQKTLPFDFVNHNHSGGNTKFEAASPELGISYPYVFDGLDLYAQYRFFKRDGQNSHLRIAAYGEGSYIVVASHETEPILADHTSGFGGGLIVTYLKNHFAVSLNTGLIYPLAYNGNATDTLGGTYPTHLQYGNARSYNLSFGYLLFPRHYKSYSQTNWNIYVEFEGKSYDAATVWQRDGPNSYNIVYPIAATTPGLSAGSYIEAYPGLQCILKSSLRIDFSVGFPIINESYLHQYPLFLFAVQRYFFFNKTSKVEKT